MATGAIPGTDSLIGRAAELHQIDALLEETRAGRGHAVVVAGEPGIGKTRLCEEILESVRDVGPAPTPRLPEWRELSDEQMLDHVPRIASTVRQVESSLQAWVGELRNRGVTWSRIGGALGMTRQSAWERFSGEE